MKYVIGGLILVLFVWFIVAQVKSIIASVRKMREKKSSGEPKADAIAQPSAEESEKEVHK